MDRDPALMSHTPNHYYSHVAGLPLLRPILFQQGSVDCDKVRCSRSVREVGDIFGTWKEIRQSSQRYPKTHRVLPRVLLHWFGV